MATLMQHKTIIFDPTQIPGEHRKLSEKVLMQRFQYFLSGTDPEREEIMPQGGESTTVEFGTLVLNDGREVMVALQLTSDYVTETVTDEQYRIDPDTGISVTTQSASSENTRVIQDMGIYPKKRRKMRIELILKDLAALVKEGISESANETNWKVGTILLPDGREILIEMSMKAEYHIVYSQRKTYHDVENNKGAL